MFERAARWIPASAWTAALCALGCGDGSPNTLEVIGTVPVDGALDVEVVPTLSVTFDEAMDPDAGRITLVPGSVRPVSAGTWSEDGQTFTVEVAQPLPPEVVVAMSIDGFASVDGLTLPEPVVVRFTTGPDRDPPDLRSSSPADGEVDVDIAGFEELVLTFDEPMDVGVTNARIVIGDAPPRGIAGVWDDGGETFRVEAAVVGLAPGVDVLVDLTGFTDVAGNPIPTDGAGGDGALGFSTAVVVAPPFVENTTPREGARRVSVDLEEISVVYSEPMDEAVTAFSLTPDDTGAPIALVGSWEESARVLVLPLAEPLRRGILYTLDLTGTRASDGTPLPAADPFTEDGRLDFLTEPPTGESCAEALRQRDGEEVDGKTVFAIPPTTEVDGVFEGDIFEADGGTASCASATPGADVVFLYEKTTPALSDGGTLLEIAVDPPEDDLVATFNIEVTDGESCAPAEARFADEQLLCVSGGRRWRQALDVGPGTYAVFVAADQPSRLFPGVTVTFGELEDADDLEGESCLAPYTEDSAIHTIVDGAHRWSIPANTIRGFDQASSWGGPGAISCVDNALYGDRSGPDAVIEIEKASPDTLLRVEVSGAGMLMEVLAGACPSDAPDRDSVSCGSGIGATRSFEGAIGLSGTMYVWVATLTPAFAFPSTSVTVEEVTVSTGEACGRGLALSEGANRVGTLASRRLGAPSCFPGGANVRWYEYTLDNEAISVTASAGGVALAEPVSGDELDCVGDGARRPAAHVLEAGETVCVGFEGRGGTVDVDVQDVTYDGPGSTSTRVLPIPLPASDNPATPSASTRRG